MSVIDFQDPALVMSPPYAKVEVPYCYTVKASGESVQLHRNPFFSTCDESKVRYILIRCKGAVKVYKDGRLIREVPCVNSF
ncbi:hypothetical protein [Thermocrinis sp.]|jgi:hypothetical protein|uniref:hypothetical protein n=1 Tax=Thermocrinis sp. TaxID=2024383 RepID=UPI003BFB5410